MWLFAFSLDVSSPGVFNPAPGEPPSWRFQLQPQSNTPEPANQVFRATWSLQTGVLQQGWNWSLQDGGSPGAGLEIPGLIIETAYYQDSSG